MAERFISVYKSEKALFSDGCPIIIAAHALLKDTLNDRILVQIKFLNISEYKITACKISVRAFAFDGTELDGVPEFSYLDINVNAGEDFGSKIPIYMPDNNTRKIVMSVIGVGYADGGSWSSLSSEWEPVPEQKLISEHFENEEIIRQYGLEAGLDSVFVPVMQKGLFQCTCGTLNQDSNQTCYKCGRSYSELSKLLDFNYLSEKKDIRLQKEEEIRKAEEEAAEIRKAKQKKRNKILAVTLPFVLVIIIVALLFPGTIKPAIDNAKAYRAAESLLEEKLFDEAKSAFEELGEYKDSSDRAMQAVYEKAEAFYEEKEYSKAITTWNTIYEYSDSKGRIQKAKIEWTESDYQKAKTLMDKKEYLEAANIFSGIETYKDAKEQYTKCIYLLAKKQIEEGDYKKAISNLKNITSYEDGADLLKASYYNYGLQLFDKNDYESAASNFAKAKDYKDAEEKRKEASYYCGCQLLDNKEYEEAVTKLVQSLGYKDADSKILEAKYQYIESHKTAEDTLTYRYLEDLVKEEYSDSQAIYDDLYQLRIQLLAINTSETDLVSNYSSLSKYNTWYFHFRFTGGPPESSAEFQMYYSIYFPDGSVLGPEPFEKKWHIGDHVYVYGWYGNPAYGSTGTCTVYVYDENDNEIGSASVMITN